MENIHRLSIGTLNTFVPAREMRPRELLKSSSSSFGRAGDWVMD